MAGDLAEGEGLPQPSGDLERRRKAKRFNERLKLTATFFNNVGVASFIAAALVPYTTGSTGTSALVAGLSAMVVLHVLGQLS